MVHNELIISVFTDHRGGLSGDCPSLQREQRLLDGLPCSPVHALGQEDQGTD